MRGLFATLERVADGAQPLRLGDAVGNMRRLGLEQPDLDRSTIPALVPWRRRGLFSGAGDGGRTGFACTTVQISARQAVGGQRMRGQMHFKYTIARTCCQRRGEILRRKSVGPNAHRQCRTVPMQWQHSSQTAFARLAHLGVHLVQRTDEHLPQPAHRRRMLGLGTPAMATFVPDSMALEQGSGKSRERKVLRAHASTHSYVWVRARACVRACASACLCGSVDVCNRRCNGQRVRALYPPAPRYTRCISHRRGCNQHIGMNATVILTWPPAGNRRLAKHSAPE